VTKGALYHHFKSKEDILKEMYRWRHQLTQDVLRKSLEDPDPIRGLHELPDTMARDYQEFAPIEFEILSLAAHDEKIRGIVSKGYEEDLEILEKFLETLAKKGKIRSDANARMLAASLYAFSLGVSVATSLGPSIFADRKARRELMALLLGTR
jgi:AcrR family transcriptional regulator